MSDKCLDEILSSFLFLFSHTSYLSEVLFGQICLGLEHFSVTPQSHPDPTYHLLSPGLLWLASWWSLCFHPCPLLMFMVHRVAKVTPLK